MDTTDSQTLPLSTENFAVFLMMMMWSSLHPTLDQCVANSVVEWTKSDRQMVIV